MSSGVICPIEVDLNTNTVTALRKTIELGPDLAEVLAVFQKHWPAPVTVDDMIRGLYGLSEPSDVDRHMRKAVTKASKNLTKHFPWLEIHTSIATGGNSWDGKKRMQTEFRLVAASAYRGAA